MQIHPTKILSGLRISLPKEYLEQTKLVEGDFVGYFISGDRIVFTPIKLEERK